MSTDSDIIRRARAQPAVFAELWNRHAVTVSRFATARVGAEAADDLVSETFLVAFERLDRYDLEHATAVPWLLGILTTLLKKHRRLEAVHWRAAHASATPDAVLDDPDEAIDAQRAVERLAGALRAMPARDRDALLLYAWGDLDYDGVATALGIPVGTVRSRLNRARRVLRAQAGRLPAVEVDRGRVDTAPIPR